MSLFVNIDEDTILNNLVACLLRESEGATGLAEEDGSVILSARTLCFGAIHRSALPGAVMDSTAAFRFAFKVAILQAMGSLFIQPGPPLLALAFLQPPWCCYLVIGDIEMRILITDILLFSCLFSATQFGFGR